MGLPLNFSDKPRLVQMEVSSHQGPCLQPTLSSQVAWVRFCRPQDCLAQCELVALSIPE